MSTSKFFVVFSVILVFLFPFFVFEGFASEDEDVAELAINRAEDAVASAYGAVLEAEQVGANISGLFAQLNVVGALLAEARVSYRLGNFDEAVLSASYCSEIGESVSNEADKLRFEAYESRVMDLWLTATESLVGVVAVVLGSFFGWRAFKRRYYRRVLTKKPEVEKDDS